MKLSILHLILFILLSQATSAQDYFFRQYNTEDGLQHPFIYTINQDNNGLLWIGTAEGLYRFNGFEFEYFASEDGLADNYVTKIFKDKTGKMWCGHQNGSISLWNNNKFIALPKTSLAKGSLTDFTEDDQGLIFAINQNQGIVTIENDTILTPLSLPIEDEPLSQIEYLGSGHFLLGTQDNLYLTKYKNRAEMSLIEKVDSYPGSKVVDILPVSEDNFIIISSVNGIFDLKFDQKSTDYKFSVIDENSDGKIDNLEAGVLDENGTLWICSLGNGIIKYEKEKKGQFARGSIISNTNGLVSDNIRSVYKDFEGNLWFGMYGEGLLKYVNNNITIYNYSPESESKNVFSVFSNKSDLIVVQENSLLRINSSDNRVLNSYPLPAGLKVGDHVTSAYFDDDGSIWLGFENSGLFKSNSSNFLFQPVFLSNDDLAKSVNYITGRNGNIWIGTRNGICRITKKTNKRKWFRTSDGLPHNNIQQLYIDSKSRILVATICSEIHYINGKEEVVKLENSKIGPVDNVVSIYEDNNFRIWVGTQGNGLWMIEKDQKINFTRSTGLISNFCYSVTGSKDGEILVGHRGGLSQINAATNNIKYFGQREGIKNSTDFYYNSSYNDTLGNTWYGTSQGLIKYSPGLTEGGSVAPLLQISALYIDGEVVDITKSEISLRPGQYELKFDFVGIHFTNPEMVTYQTYLEGYSKNWSDLTSSRRVVYDRVGFGNYKFKIRAFNENNIASEISSSFEILIKKPVYLTFWFYGLIILILSIGFYSVIRLRERNLKLVQERLLKNLDEKTKDIIVKEEIIKERKKIEKELIEAKTKAELSEKLKTSFLNNMSHEIRTPMNAIVGFSQILRDVGGTELEQKEYINNINKNAESLLAMINDIIDLSRLETGELKIVNGACSLTNLFNELLEKYQAILDDQGKTNIELIKEIPGQGDFKINADTKRLNQILSKLLDNAVKFTESGKISFGYELNQDNIKFFVKDSGIGLSKDQKEVVFDLFRKIEDDNLVLYRGTGLGLTLSKYLVNLMGGEIDVESKENVGSQFFFEIPNDSSPGEIPEIEDSSDPIDSYNRKFNGKRILLVDDNKFNQMLISNTLLKTDVSIEIAEDGWQAIELYFEKGPFNLILLDMSLPEMDGYETAMKIREKDKKVPICGYTAFPQEGDDAKVLEAGCTKYIEKPADRQLLLSSIEELLLKRHG